MKKSKDPAPIFDNNSAKNFVSELFDSIQLSKSVEDLRVSRILCKRRLS